MEQLFLDAVMEETKVCFGNTAEIWPENAYLTASTYSKHRNTFKTFWALYMSGLHGTLVEQMVERSQIKKVNYVASGVVLMICMYVCVAWKHFGLRLSFNNYYNYFKQ